MIKLEDLKKGLHVTGLVPGHVVTIVSADFVGTDALNLFYMTDEGPAAQQIYRDNEAELSVADSQIPWTFTASARDFRLALEAERIRLGCLFDPMMAIHSSNVIPLPHQIAAVYENMLPREPLRYVLADDPGAGKTVMAGLLIKELAMRGDAQRVLIVSPGSLVEQWQTEMQEKFALDFKIFSREAQEQSASGNFFLEENFVVARVDQLARIDAFREKLDKTEWDLVIIDEAHKMSAHYSGRDVKKTQRYELGEILSRISRRLLLMTATPHNGKNEDFRLWLQLLDPDRFYGVKGAEGEEVKVDESIMRRMVKEKLLKFDGTRLFPKRISSTIRYQLTPGEHALYENVTTYVVEEMDRAKKLLNSKAKNCVGFALTMLQRRLASSPEAIFQSLFRRHQRLLQNIEDIRHGRTPQGLQMPDLGDDFDEEDYSPEELERMASQILDAQTAAQSLPELEKEVETLGRLVAQAKDILDGDDDSKWKRLSELLQSRDLLDESGHRQKLIIFTEHKDTLNYLKSRIAGVIGNYRGVTEIHGGTNREVRRQVQEEFNHNPEVTVLLATDAAGEGVNLHHNCHLMINYDMPWNPNRLEQRFGRVHRIGQTETCHLWNLIAGDTREGQVFERLLAKLKEEEQALGGQVYDILGAAFDDVSLKDMLLKAIHDGNTEEARNWMKVKVDSVFDTDHLREILNRTSNLDCTLTPERLYAVKDKMDRAEARKLQPCFVRSFFLEAFTRLGGDPRERQTGRYEIPFVPARIVTAAHDLNARHPVSSRYTAVSFEKERLRLEGLAPAEFLHASHPLVSAVTHLVQEDFGKCLKPGTVMVDPTDDGVEPSLLFFVDHEVVAGTAQTPLSRRLQFVRMTASGTFGSAGWAPHLDLEEPSAAALEIAKDLRQQAWLSGDLEKKAKAYAAGKMVREHYEEIRQRQAEKMDTLEASVRTQLIKAISFYSKKYADFLAQAQSPNPPVTALANAELMRRRMDDLQNRLNQRTKAIQDQRQVVSCPPVVKGGILVIPQGLVDQKTGATHPAQVSADAVARAIIEKKAMEAVTAAEQALGNTVIDVSAEKCGWDLTSRFPSPTDDAPMREDRHLEVKGRAKGATTVTMTRNEICSAINQKDKFILAIVLVDGEETEGPYYVRNIWEHELGFGVASQNFNLADLLSKAEKPENTL